MRFHDCIVTDRLILRSFDESDVEDVFNLMRDEYIAERAGFRPFKTMEQAQGFMDRWKRGAFAITERCSDTVIGVIQTPPSGFRSADVGYWLAAGYRGLGYMTEALEAVKAYLFEETWWCDEIHIYVFSGNDASKGLALKCGFYPDYEAYRECVYSPFGKLESEERFTMTRGDYEWERRGKTFYSTASLSAAA